MVPTTLVKGKLSSGRKANATANTPLRFCNVWRLGLISANRQLLIIWDGAPWHRSQTVRTQAQQLGIELIQLPAYSPDLNPIEGLWKWMREEVTQHFCHVSLNDLFLDCKAFIDAINLDPIAMISRLWPKFDLDPDYEKLLFSS